EWLDEKLAKQSQKAKWDAPCVFANEIKKQREELVFFASPIMTRPKPAPQPEESPKPEATPEASASEQEGKPKGATEEMDVD
ncbi:hypothetical protein LPJ57_009768, partial [Coemansia sp. RSA 486]